MYTSRCTCVELCKTQYNGTFIFRLFSATLLKSPPPLKKTNSCWRGSNNSEITCKNEGMDKEMEKQPD